MLDRVLGPLERLCYRVSGARDRSEMDWKRYAKAFVLFHVVGTLFVYVLQRMQGFLPLNPAMVSAPSGRRARSTRRSAS